MTDNVRENLLGESHRINKCQLNSNVSFSGDMTGLLVNSSSRELVKTLSNAICGGSFPQRCLLIILDEWK